MTRHTKEITIGSVKIGGDNPVAVQSMTNTDTADVQATVAQIAALTRAGCEIVRVTANNAKSAEAIREIKERITIPLVADIHFDYRLAISAIENGADKIRINPGNIGAANRVKKVVDCAKAHKIPIRVGSQQRLYRAWVFWKKYGSTPQAMAEKRADSCEAAGGYGLFMI